MWMRAMIIIVFIITIMMKPKNVFAEQEKVISLIPVIIKMIILTITIINNITIIILLEITISTSHPSHYHRITTIKIE